MSEKLHHVICHVTNCTLELIRFMKLMRVIIYQDVLNLVYFATGVIWFVEIVSSLQLNWKRNPLSANSRKWPNTLKTHSKQKPMNCLSVFEHSMGLALKGSAHLFPKLHFYIHKNVMLGRNRLRELTLDSCLVIRYWCQI